jgi:hypothetical protein
MEKLVLKLPDIVDVDKSKFKIIAELDLAWTFTIFNKTHLILTPTLDHVRTLPYQIKVTIKEQNTYP